ncbi:hypothetical protein [Fibrobacter sp.]|uniref:hypothetical protein n=1 Tax=Fibrobacter sp. TaxID=35828 RepID=UPI0025C576EE|nr:hypothetical protein [Fibrobacter sp.]MBR3070334.1 hypothetical protein [Fibrobacter sp.]
MINSRSMSRTHSLIVEILIYKNLILNSRDSAVKKGNELEGDIDIEGDFFRPDLSSGKNKKLFCHFMSITPKAEISPPAGVQLRVRPFGAFGGEFCGLKLRNACSVLHSEQKRNGENGCDCLRIAEAVK